MMFPWISFRTKEKEKKKNNVTFTWVKHLQMPKESLSHSFFLLMKYPPCDMKNRSTNLVLVIVVWEKKRKNKKKNYVKLYLSNQITATDQMLNNITLYNSDRFDLFFKKKKEVDINITHYSANGKTLPYSNKR